MTETEFFRGALRAMAVGVVLLQGAAVAAEPLGAPLQLAQQQVETAIVRGIQRELLAHGYPAGPVDGIMGRETRAAIRAYQGDAGLTVDGTASRALLDHLKFALPKVNRFGEPVVGTALSVQRELAGRGYYLGPHDGLAGPATYRALDRFQTDAGLLLDTTIDSRLLQDIRDAPPEIKVDPAF
ncbi:peptidoglycan-binding domain-containing protein [Pelagibius sp.]|uniref:peptidoglycan-binding domain-containing protein n=1 Tax=Pelagibius sp. TaxID=1931238 RepID=UPI003B508AF1